MASIVIRGLDDRVKRSLAAQAARHGRSMEAEARILIEAGTSAPVANIGLALLAAVGAVGGVDELPLPGRDDEARTADFG
ncbi:FitA-like ribbon-helix-helix domain-containing protein [Arenivirga flava]|uniref:Plasmid stabilization protein n=1 Tax=Arenivirga flava TaxID=1930060 RepID=A0AA37UFK9_9MICO|nr:toxin-antitoxin system [Arenivirga flava]GMA29553.1 plasmid stabilization protein [Arenivirga flava]